MNGLCQTLGVLRIKLNHLCFSGSGGLDLAWPRSALGYPAIFNEVGKPFLGVVDG
jgi:hypothetical protein